MELARCLATVAQAHPARRAARRAVRRDGVELMAAMIRRAPGGRHHGGDHRAHHPRAGQARRPARRPRPGPPAGRGSAGRRHARPRPSSRPIWASAGSPAQRSRAHAQDLRLSVSYGGLHALEDVSLEVAEGEFVTIVGPERRGQDHAAPGHLGLGRGARPGASSTAGRTSAPLAAHQRGRARHRARAGGPARLPVAHVCWRTSSSAPTGAPPRPQRAEGLEAVMALFPVLRERRQQLAGSLSGGEQQMLALGRGLMAAAGSPAARRALAGPRPRASSSRSSRPSTASARAGA